jgi:hypothetical protein
MTIQNIPYSPIEVLKFLKWERGGSEPFWPDETIINEMGVQIRVFESLSGLVVDIIGKFLEDCDSDTESAYDLDHEISSDESLESSETSSGTSIDTSDMPELFDSSTDESTESDESEDR